MGKGEGKGLGGGGLPMAYGQPVQVGRREGIGECSPSPLPRAPLLSGARVREEEVSAAMLPPPRREHGPVGGAPGCEEPGYGGPLRG